MKKTHAAVYLFSSSLFLIPCLVNAQKRPFNCSALKRGTFYTYPKNSAEKYKLVRDENFDIDYSLTNNDSVVFKIKWIGNCSYSLEYVSTNCGLCYTQLEMLKKHKIVHDIINVTGEYYIMNSYLDKNSSNNSEDRQLSTDTVWFNAQSELRNAAIFKPLTGAEAAIEKNFRDTSSYAILYLFRPNRFMAMGNEYYVYCDNNFMFWAQNKTKAAFQIVREGQITLYAKTGGEESGVKLNIEFGKKYFVGCFIHHKVYHATPELKKIETNQGRSEYENLK